MREEQGERNGERGAAREEQGERGGERGAVSSSPNFGKQHELHVMSQVT